MMKRILAIVLFLAFCCTIHAQEKIVLTNASFHLLTKAKTFEFLNDEPIRDEFIKILDSVVQTQFGKKLTYSNKFVFKIDRPVIFGDLTPSNNFHKKDLAGYDKSSVFLSLDISEQPLEMDLPLKEVDSIYVHELLKKQNVCVYQFNAKIIRSDETVLVDKKLFVLQARPDNSYFIGFEHPLYHLNASSFTKLIKTCLPILLDPENESELIQATVLPTYVSDNFIQSEIGNSPKISTLINQNFIQFPSKDGLQSIRFQEPGYEQILLKGKKTTPLSEKLKQAILAEKPKEYIFFWEEGRDIYANKSFKLITLANVSEDFGNTKYPIWVNQKSGLPLEFLKGSYHSLLIDGDTIAHFNIQTAVLDTTKKVFYNQLVNSKDNTIYTISKDTESTKHVYHFQLQGVFKNTTFKILISGISGSSSIKEIFYNNQLVCVAQGVLYPEVISFINPTVPPAIMNPLLWLSFSRLF